ncbi:MAG: class IV adenylate cyclase [Pirellulaceae bacterium]|nr:class IV adenylate cyclase [Pirellulaceae bacterium]
MTFEVEQKFSVADIAVLEQRLVESGIKWGEILSQADRYFAHPCRDFAETDEALRIRQVGSQNCITFKGPKIDAATKTRREIELPIQDGQAAADDWEQLLMALGFAPVARVDKSRRCGTLVWQQAEVEIALDDVTGVGQFIELELVADERTLAAACQRILSLATHLGLSGAERRSYLEMLLERQSPSNEPSHRQGGTA